MRGEPLMFGGLSDPGHTGSGPHTPGGAPVAPAPSSSSSAARLAGQLIALTLTAGLLLLPVRGLTGGPSAAPLVKSIWIAALVLGMLRPSWSAAVIVLLVPLVPILPFLDHRVPQGAVPLLVISQALPLLVRIGARQARWPRDAAWWPLVILAVAGACSVAVGLTDFYFVFPGARAFLANLERALRWVVWQLPSAHPESPLVALLALTAALLAFLVVRHQARDEQRAVRLARLLVLGGLPVALFGALQALTRVGLRAPWAAFDPQIVRINSTFSDPNALAAYLTLLVPVAFGLAGASVTTRARIGWLSAAVVLVATEVATAGRMAYAATAAGLVVLALCAVRRRLDRDDPWSWMRAWYRHALRVVGAAAVGLLLLGTAAGTWFDLRHSDQTTYLHTALYTLNLRQPLQEKLKGRLEMWETALLMWRDHPVCGVGLGGVLREFPAYNARVGGFPSGTRLTAHSTFLNIGAELGLVGVVVWLAFMAVLLMSAFARPPDEERRHIAWLRLGLASGLVAYGLTMITGDRMVLPEDPVLMLAVAAVAVGLAPARPRLDRAMRLAGALAVAALVVTLPVRVSQALDDPGLVQARFGFFAEQADEAGTPYQLTADVAFLHLPPSARVVTLPVRSIAPSTISLRLTLDGRPADAMTLSDGEWHTMRFVLPPPSARQRFRRIGLIVTPPWRRPGEDRPLGVAVGAVNWSDRGPVR